MPNPSTARRPGATDLSGLCGELMGPILTTRLLQRWAPKYARGQVDSASEDTALCDIETREIVDEDTVDWDNR